MKHFFWAVLAAAVLAGLAGCGNDSTPVTITEKRPVTAPAETAKPADSVHGGMPGMAEPGGGMGGMGGMMGAASPHKPAFEWTNPESWKEETSTPMRSPNFTVKDHPDTQCYVATIAGNGGGKQANLERWYGQMGKPLPGEPEIAALPTIELLGKPCVMVEIEGDYAGMSGEKLTGAVMLGAICELEANSVFVKMIGPKEVVQGQKEAFIAFCKSMKPKAS